jgi:hypothetical protein
MQETKETIGQRLKQIRLSRQISIEKAAEATRVRVIYLQALEADNYSVMSSAAQSRGCPNYSRLRRWTRRPRLPRPHQ